MLTVKHCCSGSTALQEAGNACTDTGALRQHRREAARRWDQLGDARGCNCSGAAQPKQRKHNRHAAGAAAAAAAAHGGSSRTAIASTHCEMPNRR